MSQWVSRFLMSSCVVWMVFSQCAFAESFSRPEAIRQTETEIEALYQQWQQESPDDPITPEMFGQYLLSHPNLSKPLGVNFNSFTRTSGLPVYVFNNAVWLMGLSNSASGQFATLYLDINGYAQPNSNHSGPYTDQFQLDMDSNGKINN